MHQRGWPAVAARMTKNWQAQAEHWAWWGRLDVLHLQANTNNGAERCVGCRDGRRARRARWTGGREGRRAGRQAGAHAWAAPTAWEASRHAAALPPLRLQLLWADQVHRPAAQRPVVGTPAAGGAAHHHRAAVHPEPRAPPSGPHQEQPAAAGGARAADRGGDCGARRGAGGPLRRPRPCLGIQRERRAVGHGVPRRPELHLRLQRCGERMQESTSRWRAHGARMRRVHAQRVRAHQHAVPCPTRRRRAALLPPARRCQARRLHARAAPAGSSTPGGHQSADSGRSDGGVQRAAAGRCHQGRALPAARGRVHVPRPRAPRHLLPPDCGGAAARRAAHGAGAGGGAGGACGRAGGAGRVGRRGRGRGLVRPWPGAVLNPELPSPAAACPCHPK